MTTKQGNLVLTIREGEAVEVDGPATIILLETNHEHYKKRVLVGINAPKSTNIKRRKKDGVIKGKNWISGELPSYNIRVQGYKAKRN